MPSTAPTAPTPRISFVLAALAFALLTAAWALSRAPDALNRPLLRLVNAHAAGHLVFDALCLNLANSNTFTGAVFMAAIWQCWFGCGPEGRARLLAGTVAAFLASTLARLLQGLLPFRPRPLHDPLLGLHLSPLVDPATLSGWNSFPSDNAALWCALAATVAAVRPRLGILVLGWAVLACATRSYLGYHYPTDIVGGGALGVLLVLASGHGPARSLAGALVRTADRRPAAFYGPAFLACFLIGTQADGLRRLTTDLIEVMRRSAS